MTRRLLLTIVLSVILLWPVLLPAAGVQALFGIESPTAGPFPSDLFTIADRSHNTKLRVNLPFPDCNAHPSDCHDLHVINTLDGFNLQPRLSLPFSGPIAGDHGHQRDRVPRPPREHSPWRPLR